MNGGQRALGVFDSGVGGLAVLWELRRLAPMSDLIYFADQAHFPYGPRPAHDVLSLAEAAARRLVECGAALLVIACNTATSAAVATLRRQLDIPIVGIEPAVKPACALSRNGRIGLLATSGTVRGEALGRLTERVAGGATVYRVAAPALVEAVERGAVDAAATERLVREALAPLHAAEVDVIALGCTHFAFLRPLIERVVGPAVTVLEPAAAVARQALRVAAAEKLQLSAVGGAGHTRYLSSAGSEQIERMAALLWPFYEAHAAALRA